MDFDLDRDPATIAAAPPLIVGHAWLPKKQTKSALRGFLAYAREHNVIFVDLVEHFGKEAENIHGMTTTVALPQLDIIVHKLTDYWYRANDSTTDDRQARRIVDGVQALVTGSAGKRPCPIVDAPSIVQRLMTRRSMLSVVGGASRRFLKFMHLERGIRGKFTIGTAPYVCCAFGDISSRVSFFPVVIKHADACASVASHEMMVVPNTDALKSCKPPVTFERDTQVICQQFIPHGTHLFKVYVIGEHVHVQQRPSLSLSGESFAFNSQHLPKTFDDDEVHAHEETTDHGRAAERGIHTFARCIREECDGQLSLFGFDVVVSENDPSSAFVVDLNYFPGFEGVPEFNEWFLEHLWEVNRRAVARQ